MSPEELKIAADQIESFLKNDAVRIIGIEGFKHFQESFINEGFTDDKLEKWPALKRTSVERKRKKDGNVAKILHDSGQLEDSIDWNADFGQQAVTFKSDRPYAQVHNEGGTVTQGERSELFQRNRDEKTKKFTKGTTAGRGFSFGARSFSMPKRQFMGPSKKLEEKIVAKITARLDKILKH